MSGVFHAARTYVCPCSSTSEAIASEFMGPNEYVMANKGFPTRASLEGAPLSAPPESEAVFPSTWALGEGAPASPVWLPAQFVVSSLGPDAADAGVPEGPHAGIAPTGAQAQTQ